MAQATTGKVNERATIEVVVPARKRRMIGWATLQPGETREPTQRRDASITQDHILPPGQKRCVPAAKGSEPQRQRYSHEMTKDTIPSKLSSRGLSAPKQSRISSFGGTKFDTDNPVELKRKITRLEIENNLWALAQSQEIQQLKAEVRRLENLEAESNRTIARLTSDPFRSGAAKSESAASSDDMLRQKEKLIEFQARSIKELKSRLSEAYQHDALRSRFNIDLPENTVSMENVMTSIKRDIICAAGLLSSCLHPPHRLRLLVQRDATGDLRNLLDSTVKDSSILEATPDIALRAILFRMVRDQILYSDIWTAFHMEGFMLRAYQRAILQTAGDEFASTFHKAALLYMLDNDPGFEAGFLGAQVKELQNYTMELLDPLLNPTKVAPNKKDILREMNYLFSDTFSFRARCLAPNGIRYEVIQFEPGEPFDPVTMETQDATGMQLSPQDGDQIPAIKLCVHGMVVAHRVREPETEGLHKLKQLSQPFLVSSKSQALSEKTDWEMVGDKAIVMLG
ncbi:uncharacterized protein BJX67DRAFT_379084 [Aspergillus lucknowensis]|uniref:Uncharacterized protein n=1 Tax=Aspergillus lucknowensis TaxID=176173 RepID=A0ABR4M1Q3_9EURO